MRDASSIDSRRLDTETLPATAETVRREALRPPGLTLLAHVDLRRVGERAPLPNLLSGGEARLSRIEPLFAPPEGGAGRPLGDARLSRSPVLLRPAAGGDLEIHVASTRTAVTVDGEVVEGGRVLPAAALDEGVVLVLAGRVALLLHRLEPRLGAPPRWGLVGDSAALYRVREEIQRAGPGRGSVLLRGETGTGKELVARALHQAAGGAGPFVALNMAALPSELAAAELFGADKGAFTGAERARPGAFREASGGTLFLDEIAAAPQAIQLALLRVLEDGRVRPVGGGGEHPVDVRVLSATDLDPEAAMASGALNSPLYYRLAHDEIHLPPLRHRRDDIGQLVVHFLRQALAEIGALSHLDDRQKPWLSAELVGRLARAPWPGNVRQLRNIAHRLARRFGSRDRAELDSTVEQWLSSKNEKTSPSPPPASIRRDSSSFGEDELRAALKAHQYRIAAAARALGLPRSTFYDLLDSFHIPTAARLDAAALRAAAARCDGRPGSLFQELEVSRRALRQRLRELGLEGELGHLA